MLLRIKRSIAIIVAAGQGTRMGGEMNKQFLLLRGKPILAHTIDAFEKCESIDEIIIVVAKNEIDYCRGNIVEKYGYSKITKIIAGGKERIDSVYLGLCEIADFNSVVTIHDGARPLITTLKIKECIGIAGKSGTGVLAVQVKDTIKIVNSDMKIEKTLSRSELWTIQTPQAFGYPIIKKAYESNLRKRSINADASRENPINIVTDDSSLVEQMGVAVQVIKGDYDNIKITTPEDIIIASEILKKRSEGIK
ncbi:MAG: 2-C-methyl-D-erythritol 4-phosphate cytidylyltransferase [Clostridiales bacterium]|nr:2-C-methyl-D-erythritol 4-phosphate cytidylyltransferase [Clostridiales bacterium]